MTYLLDSITRLLGLGNDYEKCVDSTDGTMEIKDSNAISPESCMSSILCLRGLDGNHGQESHRLYEVTFNWSNPINMPVVEKTDEYRELLKKVEEMNEFRVNVWS
jgi:hypothetical protein